MPWDIKKNKVINKQTGKVRKFKSHQKALNWVKWNYAHEPGLSKGILGGYFKKK